MRISKILSFLERRAGQKSRGHGALIYTLYYYNGNISGVSPDEIKSRLNPRWFGFNVMQLKKVIRALGCTVYFTNVTLQAYRLDIDKIFVTRQHSNIAYRKRLKISFARAVATLLLGHPCKLCGKGITTIHRNQKTGRIILT
jgi:hypothetical protein